MRSSPQVLRDISALSPNGDGATPDRLHGAASRPMRSLVARAEAEDDGDDFVPQREGDRLAAFPL
jgi:hypothetical protein